MADQEAATAAATGEQRILDAFAAARAQGRAALMPYMMGGFPDQATATVIARAYSESGADLIELGVPYSDPLADGPVIHAAGTTALAAGATLESALETCAAVSGDVPVVLMAYANMLLAVGPERFASDAAAAGAAGVIVPDLPIDEAGEIGEALIGAGLALVPLLAPSTPPERRAEICSRGQGFVYVVSTAGTTGERDELPGGLAELVRAAQGDAAVPVAVGFGIGTPEQAASVGEVADGVIIGSRLVRAVSDAPDAEAAAAAVSEFLRATGDALKG
ncbi:MAG: tryptophan synthase subunit alpha [Solirubrobacterales bacterium]|nr:tryptophan synthase subunit alpha [Solirubrobacterales bacterium]